MVDNPTIEAIAELEEPKIRDTEEKVDVLIKEIIRIRPTQFDAFKRAFELFVHEWDK